MFYRFFLFSVFLTGPLVSKSQSLSQNVISCGGGFGDNSTYSLSYSIGEPEINSWSLTNCYISEGFEQGALYIKTVPVFSISISPNPVYNQLSVNFLVDSTTFLYGQIYNMAGIMLENINFGQVERGTVQLLDFSIFHNGIYLLKIITVSGKELQIFKVVKL